MKPITIINRLQIKPGCMDEFIETQRNFAGTLGPCGLIGGRMYRGTDGQSAVLVSTFESDAAREATLARAEFKAHLARLQPLIESSNPSLFEEAYTTGEFV